MHAACVEDVAPRMLVDGRGGRCESGRGGWLWRTLREWTWGMIVEDVARVDVGDGYVEDVSKALSSLWRPQNVRGEDKTSGG